MYSVGLIVALTVLQSTVGVDVDPQEDRHGVKPPSRCEVCKYLSIEIMDRLKETDSHANIETGYDMNSKKGFKYSTSELRLMEVLHEPHICNRLWGYQLHKERKDSTRFGKGKPQTFQALEGLVKRGVQVKMDVPHELWDEPTAETTALHKECVPIVSEYEEVIEDWYFHHQDSDIKLFLCRDHVLKGKPHSCLFEELQPEKKEDDESELTKDKVKKAASQQSEAKEKITPDLKSEL